MSLKKQSTSCVIQQASDGKVPIADPAAVTLPPSNNSSTTGAPSDAAKDEACIDHSLIDYLLDYQSIPLPQSKLTSMNSSAASLGKWFPKAKTIKSKLCYSNDKQSNSKVSLVLFYQYANWNNEKVSLLLEVLQIVSNTRVLGGRIRVAPEGVNATISSVDNKEMTAARTIWHFIQDLKMFDSIFNDTDFTTTGGATYIDPMMRKLTDFTTWLAKPETKEQLREKQVLLFCTGGVRCERASAYLKQQMGDSVKGCYQLQGGVERYLQTFEDGGYWRGKNFVFDKREAIAAGNKNGDGGIIKHENIRENDVGAKCCLCTKPWDRYIGKKKCHMCGVPVLMCDSCMTTRNNDIRRCPLCVKRNVIVPAADVEYTNNGVSVRSAKGEKKQAPSILKWGGGHVTEKKEKRKMKRRACQFGADCIRPDCFFAHPEREGKKRIAR